MGFIQSCQSWPRTPWLGTCSCLGLCGSFHPLFSLGLNPVCSPWLWWMGRVGHHVHAKLSEGKAFLYCTQTGLYQDCIYSTQNLEQINNKTIALFLLVLKVHTICKVERWERFCHAHKAVFQFIPDCKVHLKEMRGILWARDATFCCCFSCIF